MKKFAVCFGYLPSMNFTGFSNQLDDEKNIFTLIIKAFKDSRLIKSKIKHIIQFSSRTDRGVAALNQIVTLMSDRTPIISEINSYLPDPIRALAISEVPYDFNPRRDPVLRTYSYFLAGDLNFDYSSVRESLMMIKGTHNFHNFSKRDPPKKKLTTREIKVAEIFPLDNYTYHIRIASKSFLWQQVRRIIGHLIEVSNRDCGTQHTQYLLTSSHVKFKPSPAPPEFLVLENIKFENLQLQYDQKSLRKFQNTLKDSLMRNRANTELFSFLSTSFTEYQQF
jgi:tRNA pseudouridine38-40 synthase